MKSINGIEKSNGEMAMAAWRKRNGVSAYQWQHNGVKANNNGGGEIEQ